MELTSGKNFAEPCENFQGAARVLVVDDEPLVAWWLSEALTRRGHRVDVAGSIEEALSRFGTATRVVLLDLKLPDGCGSTLIGTLVRVNPTCRVIVMTAYGTEDVRRAVFRDGAFAVLDKPFASEEMIPLVEGAFAEGADSQETVAR